MREYYQQRAPEYDEWYLGAGRFAARDRPGWEQELRDLIRTLSALPPARTLDVGCGTGFLTRHLRGEITALDQSDAMLEIAARRMPHASVVRGDALSLPFPDAAFQRVLAAHLYGHLHPPQRSVFLTEARRVAPELVVVDSARRDGVPAEEMQERVLNDGSRHTVFKRYLAPEGLIDELGGGRVLHAGRWFVVVAHTQAG
ncbi:MAG: class I SAM-dependent methyltransferase [Gaiellales bacterium]